MKTLILFFTILFSYISLAGTTPSKVALWGSIPPSMSKPGDQLHFLAVATDGNDLEYQFSQSVDGGNAEVIKDWGRENFFNISLPQIFNNVVFSVNVRGVGEPFSVSSSQIYGFLKDIVLSANELNAGELLTISHPSFLINQSYNVNFSNTSGFSRTVVGNVAVTGQLQIAVPNFDGKVSVFVESIVSRRRALLLIHPSDGQTPVANFTFNEAPIGSGIIHFNASSSSDPDGTIASYRWNFDDQSPIGNGAMVDHAFIDYRIYNVTLTVTDNSGKTKSVTKAVDLRNTNPVANFNFYNQGNLSISLSGLSSTDIDGTVVSYHWNFGDGVTGTGAQVSHSYNSPGPYVVTLTVVDNAGGSNDISKTVIATNGANSPPIANFTFSPSSGGIPLIVQVNASTSYQPGHENEVDHGIQSCQWTVTPQGTGDKFLTSNNCITSLGIYEPGQYDINLTVTALDGQSATSKQQITVTSGGGTNQNPVANFFYVENPPNSKIVQFNGTPSYDPDGSIVSFQWSFGDGGFSFDQSPVHTYQGAGNYTVTLMVVDNGGKSSSFVRTVILTQATGLSANFNSMPTPESNLPQIDFDASISIVTGGTITSYQWNFGDGQIGAGKNITHTYLEFGDYFVTLTVNDDQGNINSISRLIHVIDTNQAPVASFGFNQTTEGPSYNVDFDASLSSDPDGTIVSYQFNFGDGNISSSQSSPLFAHEYGMRTTLMVTLTVTDNKGKANTSSKMITIIGQNQPPIANFSWETPVNTNEDMFLDATSSYDPDGEVALYRWAIDGVTVLQSGSPKVRLENNITGPRMITLTVIDNDGKEENLSHVYIVEPKSVNGANLDFLNGDLADWFMTGKVETVKRCELFELTKRNFSKSMNRKSLEYVWRKPTSKCDDTLFAAVVTSSGTDGSSGLLTQFIVGDGTYTKLKGKIILLTNEDVSPVQNNDRFKINIRSLGNDQVVNTPIFDQGISDVTWASSGAIGFRFSGPPIPFEINIGLQSMDFRVEDVGDNLVDSAMAIYDLELSNE